jgi:hypothetical protein
MSISDDENFWNDLYTELQDKEFSDAFFEALFIMAVEDETIIKANEVLKKGNDMPSEGLKEYVRLGKMTERQAIARMIQKEIDRISSSRSLRSLIQVKTLREVIEKIKDLPRN